MFAGSASSPRSQTLASLSILALLACFCADKARPAGPDASTPGPDATIAGLDADAAGPDADAAGPDADIAGPDADIAGPDADLVGPDADIPGPDAGVAGPDAAVQDPDAGEPLTIPQALQRLSSRTVFFHHKSVGGDIMNGVRDHLAENPGSGVSVVATLDPSELHPGVFAHADLNSANGTPIGKIADFHAAMDSGLGNAVQIAFMKFCFADIDGSTDVNALFNAYRSTLAQLKADYPAVRFVHVTAPLVEGDHLYNINREAFSTLLRNAYAGSEPVFDLARAEATCPDGSVTIGTTTSVIGLCPANTYDGGHLTPTGRKAVAKSLLLYLASLP